jgi:SAM-dependent methyltransferase
MENLEKMVLAWEMGKKSGASGKSSQTAYYDLVFEGYHLEGDRPWLDRWKLIRGIMDYKDKKILELGCNMGLLSIYLLKELKAKSCTGVDKTKDILEAADYIASAYEVEPEPKFVALNFNNDDEPYEETLGTDYDVIFALSMFKYIKRKGKGDRFLNYISEFPHLIYEGHEENHIEIKRFENRGFKNHKIIGNTERLLQSNDIGRKNKEIKRNIIHFWK